jgi:cell division septation protein DedD
MVAKDWVRAYALMSLAQQAGLSQATSALAQMDQHISLEQRRQSVPLASELAAQAEANRARQLAAAELQTSPERPAVGSSVRPASPPLASSPATAGADYARPRSPVAAAPVTKAPVAAAPVARAPAPAITATRPAPAPVTARPNPSPAAAAAAAPASNGPWRIQLGAFGVAGNAEALWSRVRNRPELAGRQRLLLPSGKVTRLLASGFATQGDAQAACSRLAAGGFSCLPTRN